MMGDAYRVAKQAYDKKDKTMTTRDAGLTKEQVEAAEVHTAGSSHCGEIKSKSAFSRDSTGGRDSRRERKKRGGWGQGGMYPNIYENKNLSYRLFYSRYGGEIERERYVMGVHNIYIINYENICTRRTQEHTHTYYKSYKQSGAAEAKDKTKEK
jgi:hypothetical protein